MARHDVRPAPGLAIHPPVRRQRRDAAVAGLWFRSQGLSGAQIGVLLAIPMLARALTGPLIAVWADGFRRRRTPIALLGLAMAVGYGGAGLVHGIVPWAVFWLIGATAAAALIPLSDVLTLKVAVRE